MRVIVSGDKELGKQFRDISARVRDKRTLHAIAGHKWVFEEIPKVFQESGPGWPPPLRRIGAPLQDTGRLRASWAYNATDADVRIGTNVRYSVTHQEGRVIRPRAGKKFLLIPLSPPLSSTEARSWPIGKAAIQARYPGSFFLLKGPDGPGIYRKKNGAGWKVKHFASGHRFKGAIGWMRTKTKEHGTIERIAAARRVVKIKPRIVAKASDRVIRSIESSWGAWIVFGKGQVRTYAAGTPDAGPRKGQVQ